MNDPQQSDSVADNDACRTTIDNVSQNDWEIRYRKKQTGWDRGEPNPQLARWMDHELRPPTSVLVPGCGYGHEVIALARKGFDVTAIDFADTAIRRVKQRRIEEGLSFKIKQQDLFAFCPGECFDAIYEQTCLCAIDPSQWKTYEQLLCCWLKPGGRLYTMFMQTNRPGGPPFHCPIDQMRAIFETSRWNWISEPEQIPHPTGLHEMAVILQRKSSPNRLTT